jgi:hypothetical protein
VCASDVVVPLSVIIGLLVINALVLLFIFRLKKRSVRHRRCIFDLLSYLDFPPQIPFAVADKL